MHFKNKPPFGLVYYHSLYMLILVVFDQNIS